MSGEGRRIAELVGMGGAYSSAWWTLAGPRKPLITQWNRRHQAVFVHVPKNAGMALVSALGIEQAPDTHVPAVGYRAADPKFYEQGFSFAVVRNPWDRLVSAYHFMKHDTPFAQDQRWRDRHLADVSSFPEFARRLRQPMFRSRVLTYFGFTPQWYYLCDLRGRLIVDKLLRFENLETDLRQVADRLGMAPDLVKTNSSARQSHAAYYDNETRELVARIYRRDIETFGYAFD